MPGDNQVAFASVAARLAGRLREQSSILLEMAQAVLEERWADYLAAGARWAGVEALAKHDADLMTVLVSGLCPEKSIEAHLKEQGLTAKQAAAIAGLGGTDGWD